MSVVEGRALKKSDLEAQGLSPEALVPEDDGGSVLSRMCGADLTISQNMEGTLVVHADVLCIVTRSADNGTRHIKAFLELK